MQAHSDDANGTAGLVDTMDETFTHAQLGQELFTSFLLGGIGTLRLLTGESFAVLHDIIVYLDIQHPPTDGGDEHHQSLLHVPLPRTQEPQQQGIGMVVFHHVPKRGPNLLGLHVGQGLLEFLRLTMLIVSIVDGEVGDTGGRSVRGHAGGIVDRLVVSLAEPGVLPPRLLLRGGTRRRGFTILLLQGLGLDATYLEDQGP